MAKTCYTCRHPQIKQINLRLIEGATCKAISLEFELSQDSVYFHKVHHLPKSLQKLFEKKTEKMNGELVAKAEEIESAKVTDSFDLQERFQFLVKETLGIFEVAKSGGQSLTALKSLDSLRNTYGLLINALDRLEASRRLELEIAKEKQNSSLETQKTEYEENVKILSFEELKMHSRLMDKITNQTTDLLILDGQVMGWDTPMKFNKDE